MIFVLLVYGNKYFYNNIHHRWEGLIDNATVINQWDQAFLEAKFPDNTYFINNHNQVTN